MKISCIVALIVVLGLLASVAAFAQYETDRPSKFNIKLGLYRPSSDTEFLGKKWYNEELLYDYKQNEKGRTVGQAAIGYFQSSGSDSGSVMSASISRLWWKDAKGSSAFYGGVGAGVYNIKLFGDKAVKPGAQLFGGYSFGDNYFIELRTVRVLSWKPTGLGASLDMSGWGLSVGTRRLF
jgi:hypothetical protein